MQPSTNSNTFPGFLESLRTPNSPLLSPERLAEALELPAQDLAQLARVHRNTVQLAPSSTKLQNAMVEVVKVLSAAEELTGSVDRALFWFRNHPIKEFGHRTAMELVAEGKAKAVIKYIESVGTGASG
ncbi:antitoxin Xre/MbcA/ParS toxin-binding domain-containing protein [Tahibacter soli]|uniref:DUF2384 domain-containing protein n=1 Tax=Tahibacter soli TaxID=2983605 RepID=A0A9X3YJQ9_9GAMM|nr:antitoxin Xre/MbcA/ParS toxin-binding domain-containing protein [Tahibacter soli]MDC8013644.1 DUF2384 domain-containing protein [Tahibacter soli]